MFSGRCCSGGAVALFVSLLVFSFLSGTIVVDAQLLYTTPYIQQVFLGKCLYKTSITQSNVTQSYASNEDYCNELWSRFSGTASRPSSQQNATTWAYFFELADFTTPKDEAMLWSGSYTFSQDLADNYYSLETTITGYILDGLWWCPASESNSSQFDTSTPCAYNDDVPSGYYGLAPVWREASKRYASLISGEVVVVLQSRINASDPTATPVTFRSDSIFATIELPTLDPNAVTSVVALYMPGDRSYIGVENCNNGTLLALREAVTSKFAGYGTTYHCFDDNRLIMKICTNKSNDEIESLEKGLISLNSVLAYANNFDFPTSQTYPECAVGVLAYISGVDDITDFTTPILNAYASVLNQLNQTQFLLNETQTQLQVAQQRISVLENELNQNISGGFKLHLDVVGLLWAVIFVLFV